MARFIYWMGTEVRLNERSDCFKKILLKMCSNIRSLHLHEFQKYGTKPHLAYVCQEQVLYKYTFWTLGLFLFLRLATFLSDTLRMQRNRGESLGMYKRPSTNLHYWTPSLLLFFGSATSHARGQVSSLEVNSWWTLARRSWSTMFRSVTMWRAVSRSMLLGLGGGGGGGSLTGIGVGTRGCAGGAGGLIP